MQFSEQDIASYLSANPDFFERHAELLAGLQLHSPHGNRAVSLQERQMEMVRDKVRGLEHRLAELMRNAADNEAITNKLFDWTAALLGETELARRPAALLAALQSRFDLPQSALRLWGVTPELSAGQEWGTDVGADIPVLANSLVQPYCGANAGFEAARWLPGQPAAQSLALVALRAQAGAPAFGMLVLGSLHADRFTADMGTAFLERIGQLCAAALHPLVGAR